MRYSAKERARAKYFVSIISSLVIASAIGSIAAAEAQSFRIEEATSPQSFDVAQIKPETIAFNDKVDIGAKDFSARDGAVLMPFEEWARTRPAEKKFLALFANYSEPTVIRHEASGDTGPVVQKLSMYVARARFILDRAPASIELAHDVTPAFLERIDPAIKHKTIAAADLPPLKDTQGTGNENPDRPWCTGRATLICIQSSYTMEGRIPLGIMLVNKLRDSAKKASDRIDFDSELSMLAPADLDQAGLEELTGLDFAGDRRARAEHLSRQSDHEIRQIPRRVPEPPDRRRQDRRDRVHDIGDRHRRLGQEKRIRKGAGAPQSGAGAGADRKVVVQLRRIRSAPACPNMRATRSRPSPISCSAISKSDHVFRLSRN